MDGWMDGLIDGWSWTEAYYYSSITGSRWYRAQLRGAQFGTPNRAPAPRGPDEILVLGLVAPARAAAAADAAALIQPPEP